MTLYINLYGGPGTGKSTSAAYIFAKLKMAGVNAELVREYAKEWAWGGAAITADDQDAILSEQTHRESRLHGRVDVVVTDSPLAIGAYYGRLPEYSGQVLRARKWQDRRDIDIWLVRSKPYQPAGRYESEQRAREIDVEQRAFVETLLDKELFTLGTDVRDLDDVVSEILTEVHGV